VKSRARESPNKRESENRIPASVEYNKKLNTLLSSAQNEKKQIVINKSMNKKEKSPFRDISNTYLKQK